jgi:hypothetical protein
MNMDFARWYAESFMDEGAKRDLRWKGVLAVAGKADKRTAEVLTRIAFQTPVPAAGRKTEELGDVYAKVVSQLSGGDAAFNPSESSRELQVLAAAALVRLTESFPAAALIVATASFGGMRQPDLPMDLVGNAQKALGALSARKHARTSIDGLKAEAPDVDFVVSGAALESMEPGQWKSEMERLHSATASAIEHVVPEQNRVVGLLQDRILLDEEELQMLWWLLGGFSRAFAVPFENIEPSIRSLALAYELGEMTAVSPGPASIRAMLSRAGISKEPLSFREAVNSADLEWVKSVTTSRLISPATTPIHFALEQRAELGSGDIWQTGWSSLTGLPNDISLPALTLAELFYREYIFINVEL